MLVFILRNENLVLRLLVYNAHAAPPLNELAGWLWILFSSAQVFQVFLIKIGREIVRVLSAADS